MSRNARRAPAALLALLLLASPAFAAPSWPSPPRLGELSALIIRAWHALMGSGPAEKRGPGMDPAGLVDPGTPPQAPDAVAPGDGERGPGMDPNG
jgi:hypothetical protein